MANYTKAERQKLVDELKNGLRDELKRLIKNIDLINVDSIDEMRSLSLEINGVVNSVSSIQHALKEDINESNLHIY